MPVRDKFPPEYFDANPLAGENPRGAFKRLQWGSEPTASWMIEAPEPMAVLGRLAKLIFLGGKSIKIPDWEFFLAVGTKSNLVYLVPMNSNRKPESFPLDFVGECEPLSQVKRIDYYSEKGGEPGYYFHDHEKPFPMLMVCDNHFFVLPAKHRGGRSYAVNDEGIIG